MGFDIKQYLNNRNVGNLVGGNLSDYIGQTYALVWDIGEDQRNHIGGWESFPVGLSMVQSATWNIIGSATVDSLGFLSGTATIPYVRADEIGRHLIYAVFNNRSSVETKLSVYGYFDITSYPSPSPTSPPTTPSTSAPTQTIAPSPNSFYTLTIIADENDFDIEVYTEGSFSGVTGGSYSATYPGGTIVRLVGEYIGHDLFASFTGWKITNVDTGASTSFNVRNKQDFYITMDSNKTAEAKGGLSCVIATATYGGPFASEVVFMRSVRDDMIGSNAVGKSIVEGWNRFYYSWSPQVASAIAGSSFMRSTFSVILLPLLGLMHLVAFQYNILAPINPVFASIASFLTAAQLSIAIYIALPIFGAFQLIKQIRRNRGSNRKLLDS